MNKSLQKTIQKRYKDEACKNINLGCGHNLQWISLCEGDAVLDLGCGAGSETLEIAELLGPEGYVCGIDLSPAMIAKARKKSNGAALEFITGDMSRLPFAGPTFDWVLSNCAINHAPDKKAVYREIHRVLKKGGKFVVSDITSRYELPPDIKNDPLAWADCLGGAIPTAEYLDIIREAGFAEVVELQRREYEKSGVEIIAITVKARK